MQLSSCCACMHVHPWCKHTCTFKAIVTLASTANMATAAIYNIHWFYNAYERINISCSS